MAVTRSLPVLVLFALGGGSIAACTSGTTPICDDAGDCVILPSEASVEGGFVETSAGGDGGDRSDGSAPVE
jgi:hypothetical protein